VKITSLLPAATEILASIGAADKLVSRSHECDFPPEITHLPALTRPKIDESISSIEIDRQMKEAARGAFFELNEKRLAQLAPSVILTQTTCKVCAVDADAVIRAAAQIELPQGKQPLVLDVSPRSIWELFSDILRVGEAIGRRTAAEAAVAGLRGRCETLRTMAAAAVQAAGRKPRVAIIEWLDPPMAAGNWVPELVRLAGGEDALEAMTNGADSSGQQAEALQAGPPAKSHWIDWADLAAADPDVVLLTPCGFKLDRVESEARSAPVWPHLASLRARREGRLVAIDGHHLFNRPGPRLVDSLEVLAELLHPGEFRFTATKRFSRVVDEAVDSKG